MAATLPTNDLAAFKACKSQDDIAAILGTSVQNLIFHLYSTKKPAYAQFSVPKASGAVRVISVPPYTVLRWQRRLLAFLTELYQAKGEVHGFVPGRSILSNASAHARRRLLLNLDLQDFFQSIHFGRVRGVFQKAPFDFSPAVAATLAQLCTNNGVLPQGAPTSPVLSNLVCRRLDNDLRRLASKNRCTYTRFADDISFSTDAAEFPPAIAVLFDPSTPIIVLGQDLAKTIEKHKFAVNPAKTRMQTSRQRQEVTGLTVNEQPNVPREYLRNLRALINNWRKDPKTISSKFHDADLASSTRRFPHPSLAAHLRGKLEFLNMVRAKGDRLHAKYAIQASKLPGYFPRSAVLEGAACKVHSFLSEAVWIVAGCDANGHALCNGTAFQLEGIGFVSALHVFDSDNEDIKSWKLIRACKPYDEFLIVSYRHHNSLDLTIIEVAARSHAMFRRAEQQDLKIEPVTVIGFPSWHSTADQLLVAHTQTVQLKTLHGVRLASVSYSLLSGASGGPVVNDEGHVVGVIVRNKDDPVIPNGLISIKHIDAVASATRIPL